MFKLGIIGSDNSHADAFSKLANLDEGLNGLKIADVRVTHIYGTDPARTQEVAEGGRIPHIAQRAEDMLGHVDGVICVWRHGGKHLADTLPFLKAGIPAFVDKPLACSVADATALINAAEKAKVGLTSFSTVRFATKTVEYIRELMGTADGVLAGTVQRARRSRQRIRRYLFLRDSYRGIDERRVRLRLRSVQAIAQDGSVAAICTFKNGAIVTLNMMKDLAYAFHVVAFGKKAWKEHTVDASTCYYDGMKVFLDTMKTGQWPFTREELLEPVKVLAAIERSLKEDARITC